MKYLIAILENIKYVPNLALYNLFSKTMTMDNGYKSGNVGKKITLSKNNKIVMFNKKINTKTGYIAGINMEFLKKRWKTKSK